MVRHLCADDHAPPSRFRPRIGCDRRLESVERGGLNLQRSFEQFLDRTDGLMNRRAGPSFFLCSDGEVQVGLLELDFDGVSHLEADRSQPDCRMRCSPTGPSELSPTPSGCSRQTNCRKCLQPGSRRPRVTIIPTKGIIRKCRLPNAACYLMFPPLSLPSAV
jgi:hypothetical protein